jgi:chemotaxis protein methyltransferase CheR
MSLFQQQVKPLTGADFNAISELMRSACGISLNEGKKALVSSRLERLVRRYGFDSYTGYIQFVAQRKFGPEFGEFVDTLTTNHSGFWREPEHFNFLVNAIFPACKGPVRIWSAACATGEEPYTIAMSALEAGVQECSIKATDISRAALEIALRGEYGEAKTAALPVNLRNRYLSPSQSGFPGVLGITAAVRAAVAFAPLNLLHPFGHLGQFDVIFCRNVMIYFEQETRDRLVETLVAQLSKGGYLFTGHSETLLRLPAGLQYVQPATYRKV